LTFVPTAADYAIKDTNDFKIIGLDCAAWNFETLSARRNSSVVLYSTWWVLQDI